MSILTEYISKINEFSALIRESLEKGILKNLTFSKLPAGEILKIKGTAKTVGKETVLQVETFLTEGRVTHRNLSSCDIDKAVVEYFEAGAKQADLNTTAGAASVMISKKGKLTLISKIDMSKSEKAKVLSNDREKNYIFDGTENFMTYLGISDKNGRVHDKKQPKFRQINRFAEQVRDIVKYLPEKGPVYVADLCCGKSYLSFALYHYLTFNLGREVFITCMDLKESVINYCREVAQALEYKGMNFICGDITKYRPETPLHLVVSLHACDVATDIVLDCAVANRADVILSTPCCQHEMFGIMDSPALDFLAKHSMLKQKLCSAATDALRLARLEAAGYRVDAIELIDPEDTPKNILLRGIRKKNFSACSKAAKEKLDFYIESYKFMTGRSPSSIPGIND